MAFDPVVYINEPRWMKMSFGLERIAELLERLGNPQRSLRFVHVAGTNGKGSTCAFTARVLEAAGYRTGLFTSPYIIEFSDRIQINSTKISEEDLLAVTLSVKAAADNMADHPTEFELMTAVAFLHFAQQNCDIVVCEVGLGGRLDSTNVIEAPEVCAITPISFDHMAILGNSLEEIAREKAGIIKRGIPVVSWPQDHDAMAVVEQVTAEKQAPLTIPDFDRVEFQATDFAYTDSVGHNYTHLTLGLKGSYQSYNVAVVLELIAVLRKRGWNITDEAIKNGLADTYWPGRFETVAKNPTFIIDGAHNEAAVQVLLEALQADFPGSHPIFIVGVLADKNYESMIREVFPHASAFITITPPNPRALSADDLALTIREVGYEAGLCPHRVAVYSATDIPDAIRQAYSLAEAQGDLALICAFGSLYSVETLKSVLARSAIKGCLAGED